MRLYVQKIRFVRNLPDMSGRRTKIVDSTNMLDSISTNTLVGTNIATDSTSSVHVFVSNVTAHICMYDTNDRKSISSSIECRNTCIDIRSVKSTNFTNDAKIIQTDTSDEHTIEAINILYNKVKSFDNTIDKSLGTFSKKFKEKSIFGKPNKHYSFLRVPV